MIEWDFEDRLDEFGIFTNGIDGRAASREAYMTMMDFDKMKEFLLLNKNKYSYTEWSSIKNHFQNISYLSPMNKLCQLQIEKYIFE